MQLISNKNIPVGKKISDPVLERVSDALEKSPLSDEEIASKVGVSSTTVWRWRTKKKGRTNEMILKALAETLDVNYRWLHFGKGPRDNDPNLNQIKSAKDDAYRSSLPKHISSWHTIYYIDTKNIMLPL